MATFKKLNGIKNNRQLRSCLLFYVFFAFFFSCQQTISGSAIQNQKDSIDLIQKVYRGFDTIAIYRPLVQNGDIIFRTGNDFTSESLRQLAKTDQTYSHCGIAFIENDSVFVYHAIGGEFNPNQKLKRELFDYFCSAEINRGFGIARFSWRPNQLKALQKQVQYNFVIGLPFDMAFDLTTNDKMYCSEFVAKSIASAFADSLMFATSKIGEKIFYAPDNIFLHQDCRFIKKVRF